MLDILFTYQHKVREIESLCLLKLEMERRGYTTGFLCTFVPDRILKYYKKPKLTVSSAMYNNDALWFLVYDIVGFTKKIVNLQWEQVLSNFDEANPDCFHNPKEYATEVVHLCWGEEIHNRITKNGVKIQNAPVIGAVHLDFLLPEFNDYFLSKNQIADLYDLDIKAEWCLFISSFTLHNMTPEEFTQLLDCYGDEIVAMKKITIASKMHLLNWFRFALKEFPDKIFIYRPHPDETKDESLHEMECEFKNFKVIHDYSVKQWIKCSDRIYTWYSTAVAEIEKAKKGFDILRPIEIPLDYDISIYRNAAFISNELDFIKGLNTPKQNVPLNSELLHRYYMNEGDYPSFMRAADIFEQALAGRYCDMKKFPSEFAVNLLLFQKFIREKIIDVLINIFGKSVTKIPYLKKSMEYSFDFRERLKRDLPKNLATQEEIEEICSRLRPIVYSNSFLKKENIKTN